MSEAKPAGRLPHVEEARAKLTFSLKVVGLRGDGYHLIEAEMATLDLADRLELTDGEEIEIVEDYGVESLPSLPDAIPSGSDNLVARALQAVGASAAVRIVKRIPAGAGLGGGSADAAAILRWAGVEDLVLATRLGADVPFCLKGGMARVSGIGEVIEPVDFEEIHVVLLTPPFSVSTPAVYRAWDRLGGPVSEGPNDLEAAALSVDERLVGWRDVLARLTDREPALAGSGSTWFVELEDSPQALGLAERLAAARSSLATHGVLLTCARTAP